MRNRIGNFLFKYRGFTPIPIALMIAYWNQDFNLIMVEVGLPILLLGEIIRILSVRHIGGKSRTRKVGAPQLITSGPYNYIRHPLYVGNFLIYIGIEIMSSPAHPFLETILLLTFFISQYYFIVLLEEKKLENLFNISYQEYVKNVNRFIPKLKRYTTSNSKNLLSFKKVLKHEFSTLLNIAIMLYLIFGTQGF